MKVCRFFTPDITGFLLQCFQTNSSEWCHLFDPKRIMVYGGSLQSQPQERSRSSTDRVPWLLCNNSCSSSLIYVCVYVCVLGVDSDFLRLKFMRFLRDVVFLEPVGLLVWGASVTIKRADFPAEPALHTLYTIFNLYYLGLGRISPPSGRLPCPPHLRHAQ